MSRFGWMEANWDSDDAALALGRWNARVKKVLNGRPGKTALRAFVKVLEAMPHKQLIEGALCDGTGVCVNGALVYRKWVDGGMAPKEAWKRLKVASGRSDDEYETYEQTIAVASEELGITRTLAELMAQENDYAYGTPKQRYNTVLHWAKQHMAKEGATC